jgi:hypothetical protein
MPYYHVIAVLPADRQKSLVNRTADEVFSSFILPFQINGTITARWGKKTQTYQVLELRVYQTKDAWYKKGGKTLDQFLKGSRNIYLRFEERAKELLSKTRFRVFVIMPIQGEKYGTQQEQRVFKEFDERFTELETALSKFNCVAIRVDKEQPLGSLVARIKEEIGKCRFVIADLTDERQSCYFEAGYADAIKKPIIFIASKESIIKPGEKTYIHFDIHNLVQFFANHEEMKEKVIAAIEKNKSVLLAGEP